jgi:Mn-dependent DtxR family transcriptional regulator
MPKKLAQNSVAGAANSKSDAPHSKSLSHVPAAELLSFLKQTGGAQTWTEKDMAKTLKVGLPEAKQAILVLQLQGYIEPAGQTGKWRITEEGDVVSGSKSRRFTRQSVADALDDLRDRIKAVNEDADAEYKITEAVAFGDFLGDPARVQAAEVGIRLTAKNEQLTGSGKEHRAELAFLKHLRGKSAVLHVIPYEGWMSARSHLRLL